MFKSIARAAAQNAANQRVHRTNATIKLEVGTLALMLVLAFMAGVALGWSGWTP